MKTPILFSVFALTISMLGQETVVDKAEVSIPGVKYKANVIPGESLPDPLKDKSFGKFSHDKRFVDAIRTMQSQ